jgi:fructokinase
VRAEQLPPEHPAWALEARYLALALCAWVCTISPKRIVLGGGVMQQAHLFPLIRRELAQLLNGYIRTAEITSALDAYVVPPLLGSRAGVLGALALAQEARSSAATAKTSDDIA